MTQQQYVEKITNQYRAPEENRLAQLRKLDAKVKRPAKIFAWIFGAAGALILGCGMCMAMEVIGGGIALGVIIGMAGIAVVSANYPIYSAMLSARKSKYADEIMSMGREITGGEN